MLATLANLPRAATDAVLKEAGKMTWTTEREDLLKVLWMQGLSCSQIARQLGGGISRNAVIGKVTRLGLAKRASPSRPPRRRVRAAKPDQRIIPKPRLSYDGAKPKGALRGPQNVKFIDRSPSHCPMFVEGEEGPDGFVCGLPSSDGPWCSHCAQIVFDQSARARAA